MRSRRTELSRRLQATLLAAMVAPACSGDADAPADAGASDAALIDAHASPPDAGADARVSDAGPPPDTAPTSETCEAVQADRLQDVRTTPAAPYYVHHPVPEDPSAETLIFLGGGTGSRDGARRTWFDRLAPDPRSLRYRVVLPYASFETYLDEAGRTLAILDEVLRCYGGNPERVHLAGRSNGGFAAFALMLGRPERFATLLGAPGLFPVFEPDRWAVALAGKSVFNGVGELDDGWRADVMATHEALAAAGLDSVYVEFPGEAHRLSDAFSYSIFFDWWETH